MSNARSNRSAAAAAARASELQPAEVFWSRKQPFLASRGYTLRPRYHPGWRPSWHGIPGVDPRAHEDFWKLPYWKNVIDARRVSDGQLVCIKRVQSGGSELEIVNYLSRHETRGDPQNHSVPILESFQDNEDPQITYIVMPFFRRMDNPPFDLINDVLDFADQVLEGLVYMHGQEVAHRNTVSNNILMDARAMYPQGFHPVRTGRSLDLTYPARPHTRVATMHGTRYYFIDYGVAVRIPPFETRLAIGNVGDNTTAPEMSALTPYDPFKVDVYVLGQVLQRQIHDKYYRVQFLWPLIEAMTRQDPAARPTAEQALVQWRAIRRRVLLFQRACRLRGRNEAALEAIVLDVISVLKVVYIISRLFTGWSLQWLWLLLASTGRRRE